MDDAHAQLFAGITQVAGQSFPSDFSPDLLREQLMAYFQESWNTFKENFFVEFDGTQKKFFERNACFESGLSKLFHDFTLEINEKLRVSDSEFNCNLLNLEK